MSRPSDFKVGARVSWDHQGEYVVWSLHAKRGWVWITRDGRAPVAARVANLQLLAPAAEVAKPQPLRSVPLTGSRHPAPKKISDADRRTIIVAFMTDAADHDGVINMNRIRRALSDDNGLTVPSRTLSTMYSVLAGKGTIRSLGYTDVNDDTRGGNAGKPQREWQWVGPLPASVTA